MASRWWRPPLLALVLLGWTLGPAAAEDAMGPHMAARLAEMLTPEECELFRALLEAPEPDPEAELARLSEDRRPPEDEPARPGLRRLRRQLRWRRRREPRDLQRLDADSVCRKELAVWLAAKAPALAWDRVARVLRRSGRPDVARELAKSLHQEATLELRKFAQPYQKAAAVQPTPAQPLRPRALLPDWDAADDWDAMDAWDALELIVERLPQGPYPRSRVHWVWSLIVGFFCGLLGAFGLGVLTILLSLWVTGAAGGEDQGSEDRSERPGLVSAPLLRASRPHCLWEIKALP